MSGEERYEGNVQREVVEGEKTATGVQKVGGKLFILLALEGELP